MTFGPKNEKKNCIPPYLSKIDQVKKRMQIIIIEDT